MARRGRTWLRLTALAVATMGATQGPAASLDPFGEPPTTDPSAYTAQPRDVKGALQNLLLQEETNRGSYELSNGLYSSKHEQTAGNVLPPAQQSLFNYPTNGYPSPMFGAQPWTQKLLMFEEFGLRPLDTVDRPYSLPFPQPRSGSLPEHDPDHATRSGPDGDELSAFLLQEGLWPLATREANTFTANPWKPQIQSFLNRYLAGGPAEGRPPGEGWAHQRWNEFHPQAYFKTAQAGARANRGTRDGFQLHGFNKGEFGPDGLYYSSSGTGPGGSNRDGGPRFHPDMPVQEHNSLWTFDGTFPPKLLMARYGQPILMRHYNALPIDPAANRGFGLHTISTHEHNGHNPAESDGFANAFFFPGQYYDYRWPMQLAGYDTINTTASDARAAFPCADGETLWVNDGKPNPKTCKYGKINIRGDWRETMSTHWFHDHMLDFTAQNVYKGNAVMMNYYSALDRGNEAMEDGVNLRLPSGTALPWGNRDYDVNLVVADKAWDQSGQLWFNPFNPEGFLGDRVLVNWQYAPVLDVRARRYRFRILNGSVSRFYAFAFVAECAGQRACPMPGPSGSNVSYKRVPFHMIANDGNLMEHAVPFDGTLDLDRNGDLQNHNGILPSQGIAERYDIVVDFAKLAVGTKVYMLNVLEHETGLGTRKVIALADILSGKYQPKVATVNGVPQWTGGDPGITKLLQIVVRPYTGTDYSMNPADYEPAKPGKAAGRKMIPLWLDRNDPAQMQAVQNARKRTFEFGHTVATDATPWTIKSDGGASYKADMRRVSAAPQLANGPTDAGATGNGTLEVWKLSTGGGWSHPVHVHFEEGVILKRGGLPPPEWEKWARKDVYRIGREDDSAKDVEFAIRFREFAGTYMEHCHNTQHEDNSMLLRWDIEHPGQFLVMPTPMPTWEGVTYVPSVGIQTFRTGSAAPR
ncbi:hypothetical protein GCM10028813_08900 [Ramlibacter alkalitolerans]